MFDIDHLIAVADIYKKLTDIDRDSTLSYRVFGDSKKLKNLRNGAQLTVSRFNMAMSWFESNWPHYTDKPKILTDFMSINKKERAA